ncbi:MAG: GDSL-type esterase/lipase family protein [Ruminococcus flavefaciens]|nr:GDSL-type esterase/lipase family protein [Ruminococcus flavefaciens]MCM1229161.1 GDSL-type esterase/lipase family protein [Ruminococcus flavefaciens]
MKKFISAVSAAALLISSMPAVNTAPQVSAEDDTIKIMCIGDSITDGYTNDYVGSYRKFIYHNLTEKGYNVDMVGSKGGGWTPTYTDEETGETWEFDNDNTGYSGYAIKDYSGRSGIYETLISTDCLAQTQPDIVTLQIGTNDVIDNHDISTAGERLEELVDYILDNIPQEATLFISPIPPLDPNRSDVYDWFGNYRHSSDWSEQYDDKMAQMNVEIALMQYNTQVMAVASKKKQEGRNVVFSEAAFEITDVETQLFDGVHPNNIGYKAMGAKWADTIDEYLQGSTQEETTTATTTTVTTTSETTTTETQTTVNTDFIIDSSTTTTTGEEDELDITDLVKLSDYLLGYPFGIYTEEDIKRYDLDGNGRTDVCDYILMRDVFADKGRLLLEKMGEDFVLVSNTNIVINPEDFEEHRVTTGSSASSSVMKPVGDSDSSITVDWEDVDVIS